MTDRPVIGIFGAGKVGTALARLLVDIRLRGRAHRFAAADRARPPRLGRRARRRVAATPPTSSRVRPDHRRVPFGKAGTVPWDGLRRQGRRRRHELLAARRRPHRRDRRGPALDERDHAALNPRARVVKSLNHLGYHDMEDDAMPPARRCRRAIAVVGDDADARRGRRASSTTSGSTRGRRRRARQRPRQHRARSPRVRPRAVGGGLAALPQATSACSSP